MAVNNRLSIADICSRKPMNSRLTPIDFGRPYISPAGHRRRTILCDCECGNEHTLDISYFISGRILSCGCYNVDKNELLAYSIDEINSKLPQNSRVIVLHYHGRRKMPSGQMQRHFMCECSCGNKFICASGRLISGNTLSCGCLRDENYKRKMYKGVPRFHIKRIYYNLIGRCYDPKHISYCYYGAKGVRVCDLWVNSFEEFYKWAVDNGYKPGLQLDKDIRGNGMLYSPETCFWATPIENANAKPTSVRFEYSGKFYNTRELSTMFNVEYGALWWRLKRGVSVDDAVIEAKKYVPIKFPDHLKDIKSVVNTETPNDMTELDWFNLVKGKIEQSGYGYYLIRWLRLDTGFDPDKIYYYLNKLVKKGLLVGKKTTYGWEYRISDLLQLARKDGAFVNSEESEDD